MKGSQGLFTNDVGTFGGLLHPLVVMSAFCHLLVYPLVLPIDDVICGKPEPNPSFLKSSLFPSVLKPIRSRNYLSYLQWFQMQFLKVWGKNKRFLKILNFFFTQGRAPPCPPRHHGHSVSGQAGQACTVISVLSPPSAGWGEQPATSAAGGRPGPLCTSKSRSSTSREKKVLSPIFHCEIFISSHRHLQKTCCNACNLEQIDFEVYRLLQAD